MLPREKWNMYLMSDLGDVFLSLMSRSFSSFEYAKKETSWWVVSGCPWLTAVWRTPEALTHLIRRREHSSFSRAGVYCEDLLLYCSTWYIIVAVHKTKVKVTTCKRSATYCSCGSFFVSFYCAPQFSIFDQLRPPLTNCAAPSKSRCRPLYCCWESTEGQTREKHKLLCGETL